MGLTIGPGITIGRGINIIKEIPSPPVFEYLFGDSRTYSGSGIDFSSGWNTSPGNYDINYIYNLQSNTTTGVATNTGYFNGSGSARDYWVNQGPASYLDFYGSEYIDCNDNDFVIPAGSSYTIHAIVRAYMFDNGQDPTGGIIGGNNSTFGFIPPGLSNTSYPILVASPISQGPETYAIDDTTAFQVNQWYAVACVYDAHTQTMSLYVNGVKTAQQTGLPPLAYNEPLFAGTWEGYNWLNGSIGGLTAWSRVVPEEELVAYSAMVSNAYLDQPIAISSQTFTLPGTYTYFVPQNTTAISAVVVGGGGGGTQTSYAYPGGDTIIYDSSNFIYDVPTLTSGSTNVLAFDSTSYPSLLTVDTNYVVTGYDINIAGPVSPGFAKIVYINSTDPSNVLFYLNRTIDVNPGDYFGFGPCIAWAQGAYEINDSVYNNNNGGPGYRALPMLGDGGGRGGVVDYLDSWPIGGAGAGGYSFEELKTASDLGTPKVRFDTNQTYLYTSNNEDQATGTPGIISALSNNNLTVEAIGNTTSGYSAVGTYPIKPSDKVMFSLHVDLDPDPDTIGFGVCNADFNLTDYPGGDNYSTAFFNSGIQYWQNNEQSTGLPTFTTGDTVDLAVDPTAGCLWYRVNGGDWNGDPLADPTDALTGKSMFFSGLEIDNNNVYLVVCAGYNTSLGKWSIKTSSAYTVPSGYTFVAGSALAGASGGDGTSDGIPTMKPGQNNSAAGGSGRIYDSGAGGGGIGIYGSGAPGGTGVWANQTDIDNNYLIPVGDGGEGGSSLGYTGTDGGVATAWAGGAGGFPGGGGGSAVGYYDGANGGALAFKNNYTVTPGQQLTVVVGIGGQGEDTGGAGAPGAARIIYPGDLRQFPSTFADIDESALQFDPAYSILKDPESPSTVTATLSNLNRKITAIAPNNIMGSPTLMSALAQAPIRWGQKVMFSVVLTALVGDGLNNWNAIGVAPHDINLYSYPGDTSTTNGVAFFESGIFAGDLNGNLGPQAYAQGDTIDIAVDYFNGLIYSRVNNGNWNNDPLADPATGMGGFLIKTQSNGFVNSGPLYPVVSPYYDTNTSTGNAFEFQASAAYSIPNGFTYLGS